MPWGAVAGGLASAVAGHYLNKSSGSSNGGTSSGNAPPVYIPQEQKNVDANFIGNKNQYQTSLQNQYSYIDPYNQQMLGSQMNNPYAQNAMDHANAASAQYQNAGAFAGQDAIRAWQSLGDQYNNSDRSKQMVEGFLPDVQRSSTNLYNMADQSKQQFDDLFAYQTSQLPDIKNAQRHLYSGGDRILQTANDPQNALHNRLQQQLTEQQRGAEYARGIQMTPYGAALENSANENFNIDWQNQQLQRQATGLASAQSAYGNSENMGNQYTKGTSDLITAKDLDYANLTNSAQRQRTDFLSAANESAGMNTRNLGASQQNAMNFANQGAQATNNAGQVPYNVFQQQYGNQNQAIQNYLGNNQGYFSGLNQLQSNDLGYMNFGQGAQNLGFNQNAFNNQQNQNSIASIAGPLGNAIQNTNWGSIGNTVSGWFGGGSGSGSDSNADFSAGPLF